MSRAQPREIDDKVQCRLSILDGYTIYFEKLACHVAWKIWFLHALPALSDSYSFSCQISQARENLPKHHVGGRQSLDLSSHVHIFFSFFLFLILFLTCALYQHNQHGRSGVKQQCNVAGFVLEEQSIQAATMRQQLSLNSETFPSLHICFRYCPGGNYCC